MPRHLRTADQYHRFSDRLARRAAREARRQRTLTGVSAVIIAHQATQANEAQAAMSAMLAEQGIDAPTSRRLSPLAFTSSAAGLSRILTATDLDVAWQFDRIVRSLVQDAGRSAQGVATASRPRIGWVRHLTLPSCSRCAVLAGRIYRYSDGFQRHPGCDCVHVPTSLDSGDMVYDPEQLAREGLVTGLSKADLEAIEHGADFGQVVNVRRKEAGLRESGRVLTRAGRPTPESIFRSTDSRAEAVDALSRAGYLR